MTETGMAASRLVALSSALFLVLAACQVETGGSASPPASEGVASTRGSPSATANLSPPPFPAVELPPDSRVGLTYDIGTHEVPAELAVGTLAAGSEVIVAGGPREFEGETWYEVWADPNSPPVWVRLEDPTAAVLVEATCPATDQEAMVMLAWDRVVCFGDSPLTLVGETGHCPGGVVSGEPAWLAYACWVVSDLAGGGMALHATPDSGIVFPDATVQARLGGHFDDPAAETCRYHYEGYDAADVWRLPSPTEQILLCREAFVVDEFEILE